MAEAEHKTWIICRNYHLLNQAQLSQVVASNPHLNWREDEKTNWSWSSLFYIDENEVASFFVIAMLHACSVIEVVGSIYSRIFFQIVSSCCFFWWICCMFVLHSMHVCWFSLLMCIIVKIFSEGWHETWPSRYILKMFHAVISVVQVALHYLTFHNIIIYACDFYLCSHWPHQSECFIF